MIFLTRIAIKTSLNPMISTDVNYIQRYLNAGEVGARRLHRLDPISMKRSKVCRSVKRDVMKIMFSHIANHRLRTQESFQVTTSSDELITFTYFMPNLLCSSFVLSLFLFHASKTIAASPSLSDSHIQKCCSMIFLLLSAK